MGVPGLWDVLRPAGELRSLTNLAVVDGFEANRSGARGFRIGIDASIWFYHATYGKEGENPELRTLFFRCARLMAKPLLPLFVFDGSKRPDVKRKKKVSGKQHWLTSGMQRIIEAFGFEWRVAPGEAEAELAYLNRIGVIDAILSDDVDNFLFGARTIIRNPGKMLSGNHAHPMKNAAGKDDDEHVFVYKSSSILDHEDIGLTVGGLILIGLLRGGDYNPEGLPGCGPNVAHALARCGFGDTLVEATENLSKEALPAFLTNWRHEVRQELKTNSRGFLNTKKAKLAKDLPETFPDINILMLYTKPATSERERKVAPIDYRWEREPDLGKIANVCEWFFEWGVKEIIVKRFRTVMWAPMVLRILRRAVLDEDRRKEKVTCPQLLTPRKNGKSSSFPMSPGTPSKMIAKHFSSLKLTSEEDEEEEEENRLIQKIHSKRTHASTDGVLEYRLEIAPAQLVKLTEAGVEGRRQLADGADVSDDEGGDDDEDGEGKKKKGGPKKPPPEPTTHLRIWMPACMVSIVEPELVQAFEEVEGKKAQKKADAAERKALKAQGIVAPRKGKAKTSSSKTSRARPETARVEESSESEEDFGDVFGLGKGASKKRATKKGSRVRKVSSDEEEEEELEGEDPTEIPKVSKPEVLVPARLKQQEPATKLNSFFTTQKSRLNAPSNTADGKKPSKETSSSLKTSSQERRSILFELLNSDRLSATTPAISTSTSMATSSAKTLAPFPLSLSDRDTDVIPETTVPSSSSVSAAKINSPPSIPCSPSKRNRQRSTSPSFRYNDETISSPHKSPRKKKEHTSPNCKPMATSSVVSTLNFDRRDQIPSKNPTRTHPALASSSMKPLQVARDRKPKVTVAKPPPIRLEEEESMTSDEENERPNSPSPLRPSSRKTTTERSQVRTTAQTLFQIPNPSLRKPLKSPVIIDISTDEDDEIPVLATKKSSNQRSLAKTSTKETTYEHRTHFSASSSSVEVIDLT